VPQHDPSPNCVVTVPVCVQFRAPSFSVDVHVGDHAESHGTSDVAPAIYKQRKVKVSCICVRVLKAYGSRQAIASSGRTTASSHWIGGWSAPQPVCMCWRRQKSLVPAGNWTLDHPAHSSRYTACSIPAPYMNTKHWSCNILYVADLQLIHGPSHKYALAVCLVVAVRWPKGLQHCHFKPLTVHSTDSSQHSHCTKPLMTVCSADSSQHSRCTKPLMTVRSTDSSQHSHCTVSII
jgi:hypothetical protein